MSEEMKAGIGVGSTVIHPSFGKGVVVAEMDQLIKIYFLDIDKAKDIARDFDKLEVVTRTEPQLAPISLDDIEDRFVEVIFKYLDPPVEIPMAGKWTGGKTVITAGDPSLQGKEIPNEQFFHKIVMLRDRLRVLEQNINSHAKLNDEDKVNLQQYITRIYGSLTTFNIMFREKDHQFKGTGKED